MTDAERWLEWAKRVRAIAQTGSAYTKQTKEAFDTERYAELNDIAESMLAALIDAPPRRIRDFFVEERGYPTPKLDCRAGVFRDGRILLARETTDGRWSLPGGWVDEHDTPSQSVEREALEETGFEVRAVRLVAVKDRHSHAYHPKRLDRVYKMFFLCELIGGAPRTSIETSEVDFFALDALPPLSEGRVLVDDIVMLDEYRRAPEKVAYFD